jgi:hypothetical protein
VIIAPSAISHHKPASLSRHIVSSKAARLLWTRVFLFINNWTKIRRQNWINSNPINFFRSTKIMLVAGPETAQGCSVSNIKNAQSVKLYTVRSVCKWRMRENAKKTKLRLSFTDWATSNVQLAKYLCPK